ncbi:MAG: hypothetical protein LUC92_10330 [Clostridiales bacterium]|nr:hypothetical protein [Clostridiales bacterium]
MMKNSRKSVSGCKYYRPAEGDFGLAQRGRSCGSCVYFSVKNCRKHSADEIPEYFDFE